MSEETESVSITGDELALALRIASFDCRTEAGNNFFNSFRYVSRLHEGNYSACISEGLALLSKCKALDGRAFRRIHKGSAYYWIAMAAFLANDFQTATYLFDAAVAEDIRAGHDPVTRSTPSFKFLLIQGEATEQAAKNLVEELQRRTQSAIDNYNQRPGRMTARPTFSLAYLRSQFIVPAISPGNPHMRSLPTALISFILEWFYLNLFLDLRGEPGTFEPFMVHLLKGCVVFESILRANPTVPVPPSKRSLLPVLQHLRAPLGLPNDLHVSAPSFQSIIHDLSNATDSIEDAILFTGRVRNTLGHSLAWPIGLDNDQFNKLVLMILSSSFHSVLNLYDLP